jgi:hypothetical protein
VSTATVVRPLPRRRAQEISRRAPAWLLTALASVVYLILAPKSPDLAAASYRSHLFSQVGFSLWDNSWYGGHHLLAYSLLAPALGALIGPQQLAALSMTLATALFALTLSGRVPPRAARAAELWFALGASVALLSSRVPFDLGLAIALGSLTAAQRRHATAAGVLALLASLASPVAGAFLAIAMLAWALGAADARRRRLPATLCVLALVPIVFLSVAFPEGGSEPFVASAFWPPLAVVIVVGLAIGSEQRVLRIGALLYALVLVGSFLEPSAVGGNADRLGALLAGPVAAATLLTGAPSWRRWMLLALIAPLTYWQAGAPIHDFRSTLSNPATSAAFYTPLIGELDRLDVGYGRRPVRIEVVPTVDHWEARYVAPAAMLARGWERQLDSDRNGLFYASAVLTPSRYERWLAAQSVSYVALPDASLDYAGMAEARLLGGPQASGRGGFLREVWRAPHWRLFAVRDPAPLASAGTLTQATTQSFTLRAPRPGTYVVRLHFTPYWLLSQGSGCVSESSGGWTELRARGAGTLHVVIGFSLARIFARGARCD